MVPGLPGMERPEPGGGQAWLMAGPGEREADNGGEHRASKEGFVLEALGWARTAGRAQGAVSCHDVQQVLKQQWCPHILSPTQLSRHGQH